MNNVQVTTGIGGWTDRCQAQAWRLTQRCLIGCVIPACFVHAQEITPGFLYTQGTYQTLSYPGSTSTIAADINNSGAIAGSFQMGVESAAQAFVLSDDTYTPLDVFGYSSSALGINDQGAVVGTFYDGVSYSRSFLYQDGAYSEVTIANATSVAVFGINNSGLMSGLYTASPGSDYHGFIGDGEHFTTIDVPGALGTWAYGLNDLGQVVGGFGNSSGGRSGFI